MPKVLFTQTRTVKPDGPTYDEGKVYDLPQASVDHFTSRNVATTDPALIAAAEHKARPQAAEVKSHSPKAVATPPVAESAAQHPAAAKEPEPASHTKAAPAGHMGKASHAPFEDAKSRR